MTKLHRATVKVSEYGLYVLLLSQSATGSLTALLGGRPFDLFFWRFPPIMPRNEMLQAALVFSHELGAWTLAALVVGMRPSLCFTTSSFATTHLSAWPL